MSGCAVGVAQVWSEEVAKARPRDRMFTGKSNPLDGTFAAELLLLMLMLVMVIAMVMVMETCVIIHTEIQKASVSTSNTM